jgi:thioester reductase-like protein
MSLLMKKIRLRELKKLKVFLTGANGFLGVYLLQEILKNDRYEVFCLVRGGVSRLKSDFQKYFVESTVDFSKIKVFDGDLSLDMLGLNLEEYNFLKMNVRIVIHNAFFIHHLFDYSYLRRANVLAIKWLLNLLKDKENTKFVFISAMSAVNKNPTSVFEEKDDYNLYYPKGGYNQTKRTVEILLQEASKKMGYSLLILRPCTIIGNMETGNMPFNNSHLFNLIKGCVQMEKFPNLKIDIDVLPVDLVASITLLLVEKPKKNFIVNLSSYQKIKWITILPLLENLGFNLKNISTSDWSKLLGYITEENALYKISSLYMDSNILKDMETKKSNDILTFDIAQKEFLKAGINFSPNSYKALTVSINYGFNWIKS